MRCLACGAEMRVSQIVPDDSMPVRGYAQRTLECPDCGEVERRLTFTGDTALSDPEAPSQSNPTGTAPAPSAQRDAHADDPDEAAPARWEQAVEKLRVRHTVLALQAAAQRPAQTIADERSTPADEFDRLWDDLAVPPRASPAAWHTPSEPRARSGAPRLHPIANAAKVIYTTIHRAIDQTARKLVDLGLALSRAASPPRPQRERLDAMLQIDTDALRVMPPPRRKLPRAR